MQHEAAWAGGFIAARQRAAFARRKRRKAAGGKAMTDAFPRTPVVHCNAMECGCIQGGSGCRGSLGTTQKCGSDPLQNRRTPSLQGLVQPQHAARAEAKHLYYARTFAPPKWVEDPARKRLLAGFRGSFVKHEMLAVSAAFPLFGGGFGGIIHPEEISARRKER